MELRVKYFGIDAWDRPVYVTEGGMFICDVNLGMGEPSYHTYNNNDPDSEPDFPITKREYNVIVVQ